jgi:hypothetical protein
MKIFKKLFCRLRNHKNGLIVYLYTNKAEIYCTNCHDNLKYIEKWDYLETAHNTLKNNI